MGEEKARAQKQKESEKEEMRDRLMKLIQRADAMCGSRKQCEGCVGFGKGADCCDYNIAAHLIANGVIVPPCKVGDTVYYLDGTEAVKDKVIGVVYSDDMDYLTKSVRTYDCLLAWENFGKTYFATKEEAEKALVEREGK